LLISDPQPEVGVSHKHVLPDDNVVTLGMYHDRARLRPIADNCVFLEQQPRRPAVHRGSRTCLVIKESTFADTGLLDPSHSERRSTIPGLVPWTPRLRVIVFKQTRLYIYEGATANVDPRRFFPHGIYVIGYGTIDK
jgi:hypothetical protein